MTRIFKYLFGMLLTCLSMLTFSAEIDSGTELDAINLIPDLQLMILGGLFVILMQAGFAIVEGGYGKNLKTLQCLSINYAAAIIGTVFFGLVHLLIQNSGNIEGMLKAVNNIRGWHWHVLFFYTLMASTITTIATRVLPENYSTTACWSVSFIVAGVIFPFYSSEVWGSILYGGGWLKLMGFVDFAGSTAVHSAAAWIVLAGYLVMRPDQNEQMKKRDMIFDDYKILSLALAGFILWLAWSGLSIIYISDISVSITTIVISAVAALSGAVLAVLIASLFFYSKVAWETLIKAALGGLVAITASCGFVQISTAVLIGAVSGLIVLYVPKVLKRWIHSKHVRESLVVHGICGVWGTLAVSLSYSALAMQHPVYMSVQLLGVLVCFIWSFGLAYIVFQVLKLTGNIIR